VTKGDGFTRLVAGMAHELRSPLTAIIGFSELLSSGDVDLSTAEAKDFLRDVLTSSRHMLHMLNGVLDLAQLEAGRFEMAPMPVAPSRLVEETLAILRPRLTEAQKLVRKEIDPALPSVTVDGPRVKQLLHGFLENAILHTPPGGTLTVRVWAEDETRFRLEVGDGGPGIAAEDLPKLFVGFEKLGAAVRTKRNRGTALGLAVAARLCAAMGGEIGVRSEVGVGSVFHATLPRVMASG
jgi:signal transduction histidine kinase